MLYMFHMRKRALKHRLADATARPCLALRETLLKWIAQAMDKYIVDVYSAHHDTLKPAPSLKRHVNQGEPARKYTRVHPEVSWSMLEQARASHVSVAQVLQIRHDDEHVGAEDSMSMHWMNKAVRVYQDGPL